MLPVQGTLVQSLMRELRSHMLHPMANICVCLCVYIHRERERESTPPARSKFHINNKLKKKKDLKWQPSVPPCQKAGQVNDSASLTARSQKKDEGNLSTNMKRRHDLLLSRKGG